MDVSKYQSFAAETLKVSFQDINLLVTAFTHRSYLNEHKKTAKEHNERLEFLGDAVLELAVTEYLFLNYSDPEGTLTNWRSSLVKTESIGEVAKQSGFAELLRLSRGERRGSERARDQILANTYEAVVGAIYLDQGYDETKRYIERSLLVTFDQILKDGSWMDPKSHLQEVAQSQDSHTPVYKVLDEQGPDHEKIFTVGVFINGQLIAQGSGPSKQDGQVEAAEKALERYQS